ncbi:Dof, BCAP, and BANK (DBB) motif [Popillia japonica]|uniref:Dof, BCAP, and BANK (DBB) motif n=1 Tax=Popillia japonica TaxID=7064 RepID=A0AAW1IUR3_POPJA
MDDILIVSVKNSESAALWVEYFTSYFEQFSRQANRRSFNRQANRRSFKVHHLCIEDIIEANGEIRFILEKTAAVKLQLIVICPDFLDQIAKNLNKMSCLSKLLYPNRILALLLGVTDNDIVDIHKNVLTTYSQWQRHIVGEDQDETFTKEFLGAAMTIFTRVWKQQSSISAQEKSHFSVSPKKVRQGQNSVLIILTYPLQKEDTVKISIEKDNAIVEVKTVKRRNPYTLKISIPESLTEVSAIVNVLVEKNGSIIGSRPIKCESRLRELEQILRSTTNPIEFMCQTLGFSPQDKAQLDNWMVHTFQKNMPPNFNVLSNYTIQQADKLKPRCEEFPTLLHFAAKYGLEKMAMQLIDCPGGDAASEIRNSNDCLPADIAELEGFPELAQMLRGYMKMNEFTKMYAKLKEISLNPDSINNAEEDYLTPKDVNDFYKPCPPPKPYHPPSPLSSNLEPPQEGGYMTMNNIPTKVPANEVVQKDRSLPRNKLKPASSNSNISTSSQPKDTLKPVPVYDDKCQGELMEILNDLKNNVHSITQAEKLVEEWKNRNDVQKSFREKTEQLNEMRKKYEKIQNEMKSSNSKTSLFDRMTKFFARGRSKEPKPIEKEPPVICVNTRPISSLSIQSTSSSGSSGRMSTISGCSLGDSGTHSDHEDRKNLLTNSSDDDFRAMIKDLKEGNYMVPPAPKPVNPSLLGGRMVFPPIEERPPQPIPRPVDEYYIQFPPSGLPVQTHNDENNVYIEFDSKNTQNQPSSPSAEYMNITIATAEDSKYPEYMNWPAL